MRNPYVVPPFDGKLEKKTEVFFWWSWHPNYPYWSKSCWGGVTEQQARDKLENPMASSMKYYHNKLIRENADGTLTEVANLPCQCLEIWQDIARDPHGWRKPTDATPIDGWHKYD